MSVRLIHYSIKELEEKGELSLRRSSEIFEDNFQYQSFFTMKILKKGWLFSPIIDSKNPIFHEGKLVTEPLEIKNGFSFTMAGKNFKVLAEYGKTQRSSYMKFLNFLTGFLISTIIICECVVVIYLPYKLSKEEKYGREILIQRNEKKIDIVRMIYKKAISDLPILQKAAATFILNQLNILAEFYAKNYKDISLEDSQKIEKILLRYQNILADLKEKPELFKRQELDVEDIIKEKVKTTITENNEKSI